MTGFLDQYGAGDERRTRNLRLIIVSVAGLAVLLGLLYFFFHNYRQEQLAKRFFQTLAAKDYQAAYNLWAPTPEHKRDYPMEAFLRDWGPPATQVNKVSVIEGESCESSVIVHVNTGTSGVRKVWVNRDSLRLSFPADEKGCVRALTDGSGNLYYQERHTRIYTWYRNMKYKMHGVKPE